MADQAQPQTSGLVIPPDVQKKFGALVALLQSSESMNNEERQYWINILPIMTPEQLKNLEDILASEKKQLAAIDAKYSKEVSGVAAVESMEQKIRSQKEKRLKKEEEDLQNELSKEEEILAQIQSL